MAGPLSLCVEPRAWLGSPAGASLARKRARSTHSPGRRPHIAVSTLARDAPAVARQL